ncbi:Pre-mRNA-splicing factor SPP2 [Cladobotryum mycophilum]|uniref:Pre-mRNA-splicing factor n=1 Tax=Cladobotryum mycophilum TaxID=491253 RepID=A0ABR0SAK8_9HYPO
MSDANRGRIAIKFGAGSSSTKSSRPNPPSTLGKRPRAHHALGGGSDSESEDDDRRGKHETITGFGAEGAETERRRNFKAEKKEYVIERQANRNWKDELKSQKKSKNLLPEEARAQKEGRVIETEPADQDKGLQWGLTIKEKKTEPEEEGAKEQQSPSEDAKKEEDENNKDQKPTQRTVDDEAMDALLGKVPEKKELVITAQPTEDNAYQRDVEAAGAASTLEDYEAMPVEEFGAALLRGMGWNGENRGPKVKEVRRRPNRLGLGAKELKEEEDLGGWNQNGKKKSRPRLGDYRREESKRKEGRRNEDSYKQEKERERERERDGHRDRHRDRDRDHDRHRDRDRHRDYDRDRRR